MCATAHEQNFEKKTATITQPSPPQNYNLRPRVRNLQLPQHSSRLTDSNFIIRMLYADIGLLNRLHSVHFGDEL